ncbi:MAG: hypothetical protein Q9163_002414 [Psora crenata]
MSAKPFQRNAHRKVIHNDAIHHGEHWNGVHPRYFQPGKWEHHLVDDFGRGRYGTFIKNMIRRITLNASNEREISPLVGLLSRDHNGEFLRVALPYLPDFDDPYPLRLKPIVLSRQSDKRAEKYSPTQPLDWDIGLDGAGRRIMKENMFGPDTGAGLTDGQRRLLDSTLEMGFPQIAMEFTREERRLRGMDLKKDYQGLPSDLRLPPLPLPTPRIQPTSTTASSAQISQPISATTTAFPTAVNTADTSVVGTPVYEDGPPPEFLTERCLEGVSHAEIGWTASHSPKKENVSGIQDNQLGKSAGEKTKEVEVTRMNTIEIIEIPAERKISSSELPHGAQDVVPLEVFQEFSGKTDEATCLQTKTIPKRPHVAIEKLRADLQNVKIGLDRVSQASDLVIQRQDEKPTETALPVPYMRLCRGYLPGLHEYEVLDDLSVTPGWEENCDHSSLLGPNTVRPVPSRPDREPMNSENCGYYIGRRDPGPGSAPVEDRQIGFMPEEGAWKFLVGYLRTRKGGK